MTPEQFNSKLRRLSALCGSFQNDELFAQRYQALLSEIEVLQGPRHAMLVRLRRLLDHQLQFSMNAWLKAKRETMVMPKYETREKAQ